VQTYASILRRQVDERMAGLDIQDLERPLGGWLQMMRQALGMSSAQLAARMAFRDLEPAASNVPKRTIRFGFRLCAEPPRRSTAACSTCWFLTSPSRTWCFAGRISKR
jgi:hypothetical protein